MIKDFHNTHLQREVGDWEMRPAGAGGEAEGESRHRGNSAVRKPLRTTAIGNSWTDERLSSLVLFPSLFSLLCSLRERGPHSSPNPMLTLRSAPRAGASPLSCTLCPFIIAPRFSLLTVRRSSRFGSRCGPRVTGFSLSAAPHAAVGSQAPDTYLRSTILYSVLLPTFLAIIY